MPKEIILACIDALNKENFEAAKACASDDMIFEDVLGSRNGATAYFKT